MEQIAINILPKGAKPVCHSSQFDEGRQTMFNLFNDKTPYTLSGTETISVLVRKPDGAEVIDSVTNTSDSYIIWDVSADACEVSGVCECELSIVENGILLGSKNFTMKVEEDAYNGKTIEVRTASGRIATFSTNMVEAFKSLVSEITPVQDLHGYSKPWIGGGKNKADANNQESTSDKHVRKYVLNLPVGTYTVSAFCSSTADTDCLVLFIYSDDTNSPIQYLRNGNWSQTTINATKAVKQLNIYSSTGYSTSQNYTLTAINSLQVEQGSTATAFEPYSNICPISGFSALNVTLADGDMQTVESKTVNFGQTVYGGVADVTNGKVNKTHVLTPLNNKSWVKSGNKFYTTGFDNAPDGALYTGDFACAIGTPVNKEWNALSVGECCLRSGLYSLNKWSFVYCTDAYSTVEKFVSALNADCTITYPLATPTEITTTPENLSALSGQTNNVFSDTNGDTEVEYYIEV